MCRCMSFDLCLLCYLVIGHPSLTNTTPHRPLRCAAPIAWHRMQPHINEAVDCTSHIATRELPPSIHLAVVLPTPLQPFNVSTRTGEAPRLPTPLSQSASPSLGLSGRSDGLRDKKGRTSRHPACHAMHAIMSDYRPACLPLD
uniref:Secreted protein n=1 Tax=Vitrella brassicaformis TaxID=1169539 RepID=A0A7S1P6G5_9ALVE|mmetsp:Transcript_3587/g.8152  ORF Transcript_3587/g.8152 Transcript_3587/m.8152 type:complete len:143 (+) Transcript_3587:85-513(+)